MMGGFQLGVKKNLRDDQELLEKLGLHFSFERLITHKKPKHRIEDEYSYYW